MSKKQVGKYMLDRKVGKGSYAQVWVGHCEDTNETVAVKVISRHTVNETAQLRQEVGVLRRIDHPNIVHFMDLKKSVGHYYLILEYCAGGDLAMFLKSRGRLCERSAQRFLQQLSEGLLVLHRLNFIHRDLKPQNILLSENSESAILKIADFGFARSLNPSDMAATVCGSPLYMAPEILRHERYDAKADLWSLGTILFELLYGHPPYCGSNPLQLLAIIESSPRRLLLPNEPEVSPACASLLVNVLMRFPSDRISTEDFFAHEFNLGRQYRAASHDVVNILEETPSSDGYDSPIGPMTPPTDRSSETMYITFDEPSPGEDPRRGDDADVVVPVTHTDVVFYATEIGKRGSLADSYSGTHCSLGILVRDVADRVLSSGNMVKDRVADAFGIIVKSCEYLESALDHCNDASSNATIRQELDTSLELAVLMRDKLGGNRGLSRHSHPSRWIFAYTMALVDSADSNFMLEAALLLLDHIENESARITSISNALETLRDDQDSLLRELRDRIHARLGE
jgi:hypothetical protein